MRSNKIAQPIDGAPNFRALPGFPIYGTGMPTLDGITALLRWVSGSLSPGAGKRVAALWINMREEPVVYIKGVPFVLREEVRGAVLRQGREEGVGEGVVLSGMQPPCTATPCAMHAFVRPQLSAVGAGPAAQEARAWWKTTVMQHLAHSAREPGLQIHPAACV
jgi:hypothetical protein